MAPARFEEETLDGSTHVVAVSGELDLTNVGDLRRRVEAALTDGRQRIIVDLDGLSHMDSSGLAELITCHQRATELRGGLALVVTSPTIKRMLEIRGVRHFFKVTSSRDEASQALA
jgi:anti-sigma B factor antagonist